MALTAVFGQTQTGKTYFVKNALCSQYQYFIYVNPKRERVPNATFIQGWNNNIDPFFKNQRIVIESVNQHFFEWLKFMRRYLSIDIPVAIILDELHMYENEAKGIKNLATTSASMNLDVYTLVQSVTLISKVWLTQADRKIFFYIGEEERNILNGSVYQYSLPNTMLDSLWADHDAIAGQKSHNFAIYNGSNWTFHNALGSEPPKAPEPEAKPAKDQEPEPEPQFEAPTIESGSFQSENNPESEPSTQS